MLRRQFIPFVLTLLAAFSAADRPHASICSLSSLPSRFMTLAFATLLDRRAVGAISTHDQTRLDSIEITTLRGVSVHMGSRSAEQPLDFDYRIKRGRTRQSNALAICRMLGIIV